MSNQSHTIYDIVAVRDNGEGKKPSYDRVGVFLHKADGKMSIYLPIFNRWFSVFKREPKDQQASGQTKAATKPATTDFDDDIPF